jgi:hypothetical protein
MKSSMRFGALFTLLLCSSAFGEVESRTLGAEESRFFGIINTFRTHLSLPRLEIEPTLMLAARNHSSWMAGMDFLTHYGPVDQQTPFQRMRGLGYANYTFAGENIACGFGGATETFLQFSKSPTHLRNMMHPQFHQLGIARSGTGRERCPFYWASEFGSIRPGTPEPAELSNPDLVQEAIELATGRKVAPPEGDVPSNAEAGNSDAIRVNPLGNLDITLVQCTIPSSNAKGIFTFNPNTDAVVEFERDTNSVFRGKVSYIQNGKASLLAPVYLGSVSVVSNAEFPILSVFSSPGARIGGFTIQLNTRTNQAQFDGFPARPGSAGSILCTMKF